MERRGLSPSKSAPSGRATSVELLNQCLSQHAFDFGKSLGVVFLNKPVLSNRTSILKIITQRPSTKPRPVHILGPHSETPDNRNDMADTLRRIRRPNGNLAPKRNATSTVLVIRVPFRRRPRSSDKIPHMSQHQNPRQETQLIDCLLPHIVWPAPRAFAPLPVEQSMEVCKMRRKPRPHLELGLLLMTRRRGLGHDTNGDGIGSEPQIVRVVDRSGGRGQVGDHGVGVDARLVDDDAVVDVAGDGMVRGEQGTLQGVVLCADGDVSTVCGA